MVEPSRLQVVTTAAAAPTVRIATTPVVPNNSVNSNIITIARQTNTTQANKNIITIGKPQTNVIQPAATPMTTAPTTIVLPVMNFKQQQQMVSCRCGSSVAQKRLCNPPKKLNANSP